MNNKMYFSFTSKEKKKKKEKRKKKKIKHLLFWMLLKLVPRENLFVSGDLTASNFKIGDLLMASLKILILI
jgi:uncharacterized protein with von Willebrand factor type A (vWA) domain